MPKRAVLLAMHNVSELKSFGNNVQIRSSLKFLLIRHFTFITQIVCEPKRKQNNHMVFICNTCKNNPEIKTKLT